MTDRDLLDIAGRNYRDLTEALAAMWEHVTLQQQQPQSRDN